MLTIKSIVLPSQSVTEYLPVEAPWKVFVIKGAADTWKREARARLTYQISPPRGLDTLYISIHPSQRFTREFEALRREIPPPRNGYEDFTQVGLPLGVKSYRWPKAPRILQFKDVGTLNARDIVSTLARVVVCDPLELKVHRIDLMADVIGSITIDACRTSIRIPRKRKTKEYCNQDYEPQCHESGGWETFYYGSSKSNDSFTLYDKHAELSKKHLKIPGLASCLPTSWVRIERVFKSDRIPQELNTLGGLLRNGAAFDPFSDIDIRPNCDDVTPEMLLDIASVKPSQLKNILWTHAAVKKYGRTKAGSYLRRSNGNPKKLFTWLDDAVAGASAPMLTPADLTALYQDAFKIQMSGCR